MEELEELEYTGLVVAFSHENTIAIGTAKAFKCFCQEFVEYVHAVIIAGKVVHIKSVGHDYCILSSFS